MRSSARLQLLASLILCATSAHGIMVKFGTNEGPIVPPTPEPQLPVPQPYRAPAPVWEPRSNDSPDPNAQWRPQLFKPQPRYTEAVLHLPPLTPLPLNNAQRFVNSYIPNPQPAQGGAPYFQPTQVLSSQSLPGFGLRYFVPEYINDAQIRAQRPESSNNGIETNDVDGSHRDAGSDLQWKNEKDSGRRLVRHTEGTVEQTPYVDRYVYIWPAYVPPAHQ